MSKSNHIHKHDHDCDCEELNIAKNALDISDIGNIYQFDGKKIIKYVEDGKTAETLGTEAKD